MLKFFTNLGSSASLTVMFITFMFVYFGVKHFGVFVTWRCGLCGKLNETNLVKFMLGWCDHMGDFN